MSLDGNNDETNGYYSVIKNGVVANSDFVKAVLPPIGSVISWLKTLTGTPTLPDGWVECDGSTISDADSPYDGVTIPDLNGDNRFLRGSSTSGTTGGSETHTHTGTTSQVDSNPGAGDGNASTTFYRGTLPHSHTFTTDSSSTLPTYYEVVWIIRIK